MQVLILLCAGPLAAAIAFATNWLALIPWRRVRDQHWTERARLFFPVRVAAGANLWMLPAVLSMAAYVVWPEETPHWAILVLLAAIGAVAGTIPMDREVFPRIALNDLLRQALRAWVLRFLMWFVFLAAIALMPDEFNLRAAIIGALVPVFLVFWNRDGWIRIGRALGLFAPAPERLQTIVRDTAARMKVPFREVHLMRVSVAQAFAMPGTRRLLFTERLLELLPDDEIAVVCSHELAHLMEARREYSRRYVVWLAFLPWIFFRPMVHAFGMPGFLAMALCTVLAPALFRKVSHQLEVRADLLAQAHEPDPGTYARALTRLYEDNLLPAVNAKQRSTHPHLYDRLLAAGVTPDFPRPAPAQTMAWHGSLCSTALGILAAILVLRLTSFFFLKDAG